jgi:hypothetical protein
MRLRRDRHGGYHPTADTTLHRAHLSNAQRLRGGRLVPAQIDVLGLPHSRPMSALGQRCHELRRLQCAVNDSGSNRTRRREVCHGRAGGSLRPPFATFHESSAPPMSRDMPHHSHRYVDRLDLAVPPLANDRCHVTLRRSTSSDSER